MTSGIPLPLPLPRRVKKAAFTNENTAKNFSDFLSAATVAALFVFDVVLFFRCMSSFEPVQVGLFFCLEKLPDFVVSLPNNLFRASQNLSDFRGVHRCRS